MNPMNRAGDGDCGSTLKRGAEAVRAALASRAGDFDTAAGAAEGLAAAVRSMGGTSGALYSLGLTAAAGVVLFQHRKSEDSIKYTQPKTAVSTTLLSLLPQAWSACA